jgi:1,6-anhydro-N-acetylmuramate kinase
MAAALCALALMAAPLAVIAEAVDVNRATEAQLDGVFADEAGGLAWLTERMAKGVV